MPPETICKTVRQYNKEPISLEDMRKLQEIADDYRSIKNYVYARYGGIGSLSKLYPGYTIQNEMTESGLRAELGLPSVYFYLAIFDALGDIKSQWTKTKTKVMKLVGQNKSFTEEEKHYLRFLLKVSSAFEAILNQKPMELPKEIQEQHNRLSEQVDTAKLHRYLCRQVRKYNTKHGKMYTGKADYFSIAERAYRYGNNGIYNGIYISTKENRKRIFVPLTDNNRYKNQLYIKLYPEDRNIEINVAINVTVHPRRGYVNQVGIAVGMFTMLTTNEGHCFGAELGKYQIEYAEWIQKQSRSYNCNCADNPGRKKYNAQKRRLEERLHSYINHELNLFLKEEQPQTIYMVRFPRTQAGGINRKINHSVTMWQRGYIRRRLMQKCKEQSVNIVEVFGKDISKECNCCGAIGLKKDGIFSCTSCGYSVEEKTNTARNVLKRGIEGKVVN